MKTKFYTLCILLLSIWAIPGMLRAANPEERQERQVRGFHAIQVSAGIDLVLEYGPQEIVVVEGDHEDLNRILTEVKDGTLHIYRKGNPGFHFNFHDDCEVYVTAKSLEELEASSGSEVKCSNRFHGNELEVRASSGSEISLDLAYEKLKADSGSGSEITLKGKARYLSVSVSSGSEIDACELEAEIVHADASSGGEACVDALRELHAHASSGGDVNYKGSPAILDTHESSGGDISGH